MRPARCCQYLILDNVYRAAPALASPHQFSTLFLPELRMWEIVVDLRFVLRFSQVPKKVDSVLKALYQVRRKNLA
jgi:hypothetical protein